MPDAARKIKTDMGEARKPNDSGDLRFYGKEFPLEDCTVGEIVEMTVKGKVTSIRSDEYGHSIGFDIEDVEKYEE
jgi:hypothetical protein